MPPDRAPPLLLPLLIAAEPRSLAKPDRGQRHGGPFSPLLGAGRRGTTASSSGVAPAQGAMGCLLGGERCSVVVDMDVPRRWHPWLRRRPGRWLNGGAWRFTVQAVGCVGNRSLIWPSPPLSRLACGRRGRHIWCPLLTSGEAIYGESWALLEGRAFPPCSGWASPALGLVDVKGGGTCRLRWPRVQCLALARISSSRPSLPRPCIHCKTSNGVIRQPARLCLCCQIWAAQGAGKIRGDHHGGALRP